MNHTLTAKMHCTARIRERLNRNSISRDINKMRMALINDNTDCFLRREYSGAITGIVRYQNRWTTAVYDKRLKRVITVGISLSKRRLKNG